MDETKNTVTPDLICPNCGRAEMEPDSNFFTTIDLLEGLCLILLTAVLACVIWVFGGWALVQLGTPPDAPLGMKVFCGILVAVMAFYCAYGIVAEVSVEQNRNNGISIWYLRCSHCHRRYRVVRPRGTMPPWESESAPADPE